jgi:organic hydroperoxide reductase OsmC/OhrA
LVLAKTRKGAGQLNCDKPTQMAIPLQMDTNPEQLIAAMRRVEGHGPDNAFKE